ncbi:MAG: YdeI/OmpD-associated family protein [Saprospiraceae bacterium]
MNPTFFPDSSAFRQWLELNHKTETELIVGFYKVGTGKPSMTWSQSVDEALCFGWIDAVRKSIDKERYQIRFTQRKPSSIWSAVNIQKMEDLISKGLMQEAGLAIFQHRKEHLSKVYSFENEEMTFSPEMEKQFKENEKAWAYFQDLAPGYRKTSSHWVMSAKQEATRIKRLSQLILESEAGTNQWKDSKYSKK